MIPRTSKSQPNHYTNCAVVGDRKVKVNFTLEQATKSQMGCVYIYSSTLSLTSALDCGGWSMPHPNCFTPGKETHYPLLVEVWGS